MIIIGCVYLLPRLIRSSGSYQHILLLIFVIVMSISLGEIIFRIIGKDQCYNERNEESINHILLTDYQSAFASQEKGWLHILSPDMVIDHFRTEFNYSLHTNSLGLPDREYVTDSHVHIYRIAAFGDSYTEGVGAPQDSSWPRQLQCILRSGSTDSVEVMNCGVSGSDPIFEFMLLKQKILRYKPDMVIVAYNQSDITDCIIRGGFERFRPDGTVSYSKGPWWEWIYANSFLCRRVVHGVLHYNNLLLSPDGYQTRNDQAINILKQSVDSLSHLCTDSHCRLTLVFHPALFEIRSDKQELQPVLDHALHRGLNVIDILEYFKREIKRDSMDKYFWKIDRHNNSRGYTLFARAVAEHMGHSDSLPFPAAIQSTSR